MRAFSWLLANESINNMILLTESKWFDSSAPRENNNNKNSVFVAARIEWKCPQNSLIVSCHTKLQSFICSFCYDAALSLSSSTLLLHQLLSRYSASPLTVATHTNTMPRRQNKNTQTIKINIQPKLMRLQFGGCVCGHEIFAVAER